MTGLVPSELQSNNVTNKAPTDQPRLLPVPARRLSPER